MRLSVLLLLALAGCYACDCSEPSVQVKRDRADVIFRGTIVEFRNESKPGLLVGVAQDTKRIVIFKVSRVWKGQVSETFEMPGIEEAAACIGFWPKFLKVGEDLLVYASRFGSSDYVTGICGHHKPAKDAEKDFRVLGRGRDPQRSRRRVK